MLWLCAFFSVFAQDYQSFFSQLIADEKPTNITRNSHYIVSNEAYQDIFQPFLAHKGGVLLGVGSEQLYTLAGWMKPDVLVPMDFDQYIVDLHRVYGLLFLHASNPESFLELWNEANSTRVEQWILEEFQEHSEGMLKVFRFGRPHIENHLKKLQMRFEKRNISFFLNSQEQYEYCVSLHKEKRVFPVRGDLTKAQTIHSISQAAQKANTPIQVVYLSNAEQYFPFDDVYRNNFLDAYWGADAIILRTLPLGKDYRYYVQNAHNFQEYLRNSQYTSVREMVKERKVIPNTDERGFLLPHSPKRKDSAK